MKQNKQYKVISTSSMTARKIFIIALFAFLLLSAASAKKTKLTIKNILGADADELGDYDLFTRAQETDANDETQTENIFSFLLETDFRLT